MPKFMFTDQVTTPRGPLPSPILISSSFSPSCAPTPEFPPLRLTPSARFVTFSELSHQVRHAHAVISPKAPPNPLIGPGLALLRPGPDLGCRPAACRLHRLRYGQFHHCPSGLSPRARHHHRRRYLDSFHG